MSIVNEVRSILKIVYKDPIQNLMGRHDPVFRNIRKEVWRGRELRYANIYSRSPAVASNHDVSSQIARNAGTRNAEWVVPLDERQLFADTVVTQKQILASKDRSGAYQAIGQNLMFGSMSGLRRVAARLFYGKGFGEFGTVQAGTQLNNSLTMAPLNLGSNTITMSRAAVAGIDVGVQFQFADGATGLPAANASVNVVTNIASAPASMGFPAGTCIVTFNATAADTPATGQMMVYLGNHNGTVSNPGEICAPHGLAALFPSVPSERGSVLYGVDRGIYPDRLSGRFVDDSGLAAASNTKVATVTRCFSEVRQAGAEPSVIVLSTNDYLAIYNEIFAQGGNAGNMRFMQDTKTDPRGNKLTFGPQEYAFAMATSWLERVVDTPFLEDGTFYVLTQEDLFIPTYSNWSPVDTNNGVDNNAPGRGEDPLAESDRSEDAMRVNIDDIFTVEPSQGSPDGTAVSVTASLFYDLCAFNPANHGVGRFPGAVGATGMSAAKAKV